MKTVKTISMMLALTVIATIAFATGNLRVNILPLTADRAVVAISNNAESQFEIEVKDSQGETLYYNQTTYQSLEYNKVFDFSKLEVGDYKLVVNIDGEKSERAFAIEHNKINVGKNQVKLKPSFLYKDQILRVAYLNFANDKTISLSLYDASNLVYSKELKNKFSVNEGLSLAKLQKGSYKAVLTTVDDAYEYLFTVE